MNLTEFKFSFFVEVFVKLSDQSWISCKSLEFRTFSLHFYELDLLIETIYSSKVLLIFSLKIIRTWCYNVEDIFNYIYSSFSNLFTLSSLCIHSLFFLLLFLIIIRFSDSIEINSGKFYFPRKLLISCTLKHLLKGWESNFLWLCIKFIFLHCYLYIFHYM